MNYCAGGGGGGLSRFYAAATSAYVLLTGLEAATSSLDAGVNKETESYDEQGRRSRKRKHSNVTEHVSDENISK